MELRRAILLFAIVLGLAAIVSSIARPPERGGDDQETTGQRAADAKAAPAARPVAETPRPATVEFRSGAKPQTRTIELGQPATVLVDVETAGQIDIPSLGLTDAAEPLTPAIFEILETAAGSHPIVAQPAASDALPKKVGTLEVVPPS